MMANMEASSEADDAGALRLAGVIAHQEQRFDAAIDAFRRLAESTARSDAQRAADLANLGATLRAAGKMDDAEATYRRALTLDPNCAAAHHNLGNLLTASGRVGDAEAEQREAVRIVPS